MKFNEQTWELLVSRVNENNYHKSLEKIVLLMPKLIDDFPNLIIYGPENSGKYSFVLSLLNRYSPSNLKYEKKILIEPSKSQDNYIIKMSDVHFEVDFNLLGCNGKQLWFTIYNQILEIASFNKNQKSIIVCKNFQNINIETLEVFYSYLQKSFYTPNLGFILMTNSYSFIPNNIKNLFIPLCISKTEFEKLSKQTSINQIEDIKLEKIVTDLYSLSKNIKKINFHDVRTKLYNLLIFNHSITKFVEFVTIELISKSNLNNLQIDKLIETNEKFLYYFQNNYRPIFHLESYFYSIVEIVNEFGKGH